MQKLNQSAKCSVDMLFLLASTSSVLGTYIFCCAKLLCKGVEYGGLMICYKLFEETVFIFVQRSSAKVSVC